MAAGNMIRLLLMIGMMITLLLHGIIMFGMTGLPRQINQPYSKTHLLLGP